MGADDRRLWIEVFMLALSKSHDAAMAQAVADEASDRFRARFAVSDPMDNLHV